MILTGPKVLWAWFFNVSTPFHLVASAAGGRRSKKVASMELKIVQQVAYGLVISASPGFRACQNPYGFTAI